MDNMTSDLPMTAVGYVLSFYEMWDRDRLTDFLQI